MEYKGFIYSQELDIEPNEVAKIFHNIRTPEGRTIYMDWSSYSTPSQNDFELYIDLGLPDRMHPSLHFEGKNVFCPIDRNDLIKIRMDILSLSIID
jgi:hypothetical protein